MVTRARGSGDGGDEKPARFPNRCADDPPYCIGLHIAPRLSAATRQPGGSWRADCPLHRGTPGGTITISPGTRGARVVIRCFAPACPAFGQWRKLRPALIGAGVPATCLGRADNAEAAEISRHATRATLVADLAAGAITPATYAVHSLMLERGITFNEAITAVIGPKAIRNSGRYRWSRGPGGGA